MPNTYDDGLSQTEYTTPTVLYSDYFNHNYQQSFNEQNYLDNNEYKNPLFFYDYDNGYGNAELFYDSNNLNSNYYGSNLDSDFKDNYGYENSDAHLVYDAYNLDSDYDDSSYDSDYDDSEFSDIEHDSNFTWLNKFQPLENIPEQQNKLLQDEIKFTAGHTPYYWKSVAEHAFNYVPVLDDVKYNAGHTDKYWQRTQHAENFKPTLNEINKLGLNEERNSLLTKFNDYQELVSQLPKVYNSLKVKHYNDSKSVFKSIFSNNEPAKHRLDAIKNIQKIVQDVDENLLYLKADPDLFNINDPAIVIKSQQQQLQQAVLTLKGAVLKESDSIKQSYESSYLPGKPENSAMFSALEKVFNCQSMTSDEKSQAREQLNKFEDRLKSFDESAEHNQSAAFVV